MEMEVKAAILDREKNVNLCYTNKNSLITKAPQERDGTITVDSSMRVSLKRQRNYKRNVLLSQE